MLMSQLSFTYIIDFVTNENLDTDDSMYMDWVHIGTVSSDPDYIFTYDPGESIETLWKGNIMAVQWRRGPGPRYIFATLMLMHDMHKHDECTGIKIEFPSILRLRKF